MIALVTQDSRFYYEAVNQLKGMGIEFTSLKLGDLIPEDIKVVLTSPGERDKINFENIVSGEDLRYAISECLKISRGIKHVGTLTVGVDPGRKPGIAVFVDGRLMETSQLESPEDVLKSAHRAISVYQGRKSILRVGMGGGIYSKRILKTLQENLGEAVVIEAVDETDTTPGAGEITSRGLRDIEAAVNIAAKNGVALRRRVDVNPKPGEIKQLQVESRKLNGDITISKELAEKVALGELTLEDAVEEQAGRNDVHRDKNGTFNR